MIYLRRISQLLFLALFFALFHHLGDSLGAPPHHHIFMYASPLFALTGGSAGYWLAAGIALLTIFLGGFFCGWVCPLGACIDIGDRVINLVRRKRKSAFPSQTRYLILLAVLLALFFGVNSAYLFQPSAILLKAATFLTFPAEGVGLFTRWLFPAISLAIILLSFFQRRFYCCKICPEGAVYSLLALFSPLKRRIGEGCNACAKCDIVCKGSERNDECFRCLSCEKACPKKIIKFKFSAPKAPPAMDISRRGLLFSLGLGLTGVYLAKTAKPRDYIRPPGSQPEEHFAKFCIKCGECLKVCPTGGLQPCFSDFDNLFTPVLVPRIGYCEQRCHACSRVCPSDAIMSYKEDQKAFMPIGKSAVNPPSCLAYQGKVCLICLEHCSYQAIKKVLKKGLWVPEVILEKCVGCGQCEFVCPARPNRAITVAPPANRE